MQTRRKRNGVESCASISGSGRVPYPLRVKLYHIKMKYEGYKSWALYWDSCCQPNLHRVPHSPSPQSIPHRPHHPAQKNPRPEPPKQKINIAKPARRPNRPPIPRQSHPPTKKNASRGLVGEGEKLLNLTLWLNSPAKTTIIVMGFLLTVSDPCDSLVVCVDMITQAGRRENDYSI